MRRWIGVDLDGTLAKSVAQTGEEIGAPVHSMVQLVTGWLAHGEDVRIFTARVNPNRHQAEALRARRAIEAWCKRHIGQILPVTYEKDWDMVLLLDDRARQVERDTGRVICGNPRADLKVYRYTINRDRRQMKRGRGFCGRPDHLRVGQRMDERKRHEAGVNSRIPMRRTCSDRVNQA